MVNKQASASNAVHRVPAGTPAGGQFATHHRADAAITLTTAPDLSDEDVDFATGGGCGLVAARLAAAVDGEVMILTTDGGGWVHAATLLPDERVVDAKGVSEGEHILDNDLYFASFTEEEHDAGEPYLITVPSDHVNWKDAETEADRARADHIAAQLAAWLSTMPRT